MASVNERLVDIALDHVTASDFELFVKAFYQSVAGVEFVPTGGIKDGGADGYQTPGLFEGNKPGTFYQASIQENHKQKIRYTVNRLREFGREPKSLVYITARPIAVPDRDEEELSMETDVFVKIRSKNWIISNINHSTQTIGAFKTYLLPHVSFLEEFGGATFIERPKHLQSRAVCVFLGQEAERRRKNSPLIESITDSLILWSLEGTDPDKGIFLTRAQLQQCIEDAFPTAKQFIRGILDHRLKILSSKGNPSGREIRHHRKEDKYCLPYETRLIIEQENVEDEYIKVKVLEELETSAAGMLEEEGAGEGSAVKIAKLVLRAIETTFEVSGLELAAFLEGDQEMTECPPISEHVDTAMQEYGFSGNSALVAKDIAMRLIRKAFYESTSIQREYFGKVSRTYALLFSLRADPRIVEYFQSMASRFILFVGTDILVRALSEQYLKPDDQMTCNLLQILADAGSELCLCEPVLDEIHRHLQITDWEFINYFSEQEPYVDLNIARHANKILIRSYFYAKLRPVEGVVVPKGWKSHIGQFCDYDKLHDKNGEGRRQLKRYLMDRFHMTFLDNEELNSYSSEADISSVSEMIKPVKKDDVLAINDSKIICAVFGKRKALKEDHKANPYGYATWWLTQETLVQRATAELVRKKGAKYIIRPDFILNFIALSPSMEEVRKTHRKIMPTLLGIKLSNRMREDIFQDVMNRAKDALSVDEARARVIMGDLSNQLKGDFFKQYEVSWEQECSIDH